MNRTKSLYLHSPKKIDAWLGELPLNDATLARFVKDMAEVDNQFSLSTIRMVVAAVNKRAELLEQPQVSGPRTKNAMKTASLATRSRGQVKGLQWEKVRRICAVCGVRQKACPCPNAVDRGTIGSQARRIQADLKFPGAPLDEIKEQARCLLKDIAVFQRDMEQYGLTRPRVASQREVRGGADRPIVEPSVRQVSLFFETGTRRGGAG